MWSFDASCVTTPPRIKPEQIKKLRQHLRISQAVFVRYLNTSESTIEKWENRRKAAERHGTQTPFGDEKYGLKVLSWYESIAALAGANGVGSPEVLQNPSVLSVFTAW